MRIDRDINAARNILAQGLGEVKPMETKALALGNKSETIVREVGNVLKTTTDDKGIPCSFL